MNPPDESTGEALRRFMRCVPSPVTIVTAFDGEVMRGMTAGSFTSLSLDPPLVCFNVTKTSRMHRVLTGSAFYAIHVLTDEQADLSEHFALPMVSPAEQFEPVVVRQSPEGIPLIDGTLGILRCRSYDVIEAGDHSIFVGEVIGMEQAEEPDRPLLYYQRGYHEVGEVVYRPDRSVSPKRAGGETTLPVTPAPKNAKS